ncbi:MAG: hypothetical protein HYX26_02815 [Acidobacteriales bacterium]|nr:hypothetical protein [Terriglobales bacterium]
MDFSVEVGPEAPALEVPWSAKDGSTRYFDLRARPELLLEIPEANQNQELARFLSLLNAEHSLVQTAKCDAWLTDEIREEESIFGAQWKFASYVDLFLTAEQKQGDLDTHEIVARGLCRLLAKAPDMSVAAEFIIRRCYFHRSADMEKSDDGFCITFYLAGYGDDEDQARLRWIIGLNLVQHALMQFSAQRELLR